MDWIYEEDKTMKEKDGIFKFIAAAMLFAAAACAIVAYWEQIVDLIYAIGDKLEELGAKNITLPSESDDFDDDADLELI